MPSDKMLRWFERYKLFSEMYYEMLFADKSWLPDFEPQIVDGMIVGYAYGFSTEAHFAAADRIRLAAWESVGGWVV